jgi:hypothetical protein
VAVFVKGSSSCYLPSLLEQHGNIAFFFFFFDGFEFQKGRAAHDRGALGLRSRHQRMAAAQPPLHLNVYTYR